MTHSARLAAAGLTLPSVAAPVGSYIPAIRHGVLVFTSGQVPFVDGALQATGIVGDTVSADVAADCARTAALNAVAAAADAAGGIDRIASVVRVVGYVASAPEFGGQPAVMNAASDLMIEIFGEAGRHVRSAVGVAALPMGAPVEVELTVSLSN
ncbi:RidA family protein [Demequina sp. TTPB684]|uniref:RidA family protein n=1 Tax=unclassified Demequina TaxID=2620311 RepID=UPI001CF4B28E|nr:RidA family protein [Demequina sp. TMPB413]MCB2413214.1 RidA family protein [Demequina sp. TTPB684]UPU88211.1 RidA family protein [Demequina sp. TMPB413]